MNRQYSSGTPSPCSAAAIRERISLRSIPAFLFVLRLRTDLRGRTRGLSRAPRRHVRTDRRARRLTTWPFAQPPVERETEAQGAQERERDKPGPTVATRRELSEIGREYARREEHIEDEGEGESILQSGLK